MTQIRIRQGTAAQWASSNPVLADGEPGYDTTNDVFKVGNGSSTWSNLPALGGGQGVTDHGALTGLGDDDHTQYMTQTEGDARYYTETEMDTFLAAKSPVVQTISAKTASYTLAAGDVNTLLTFSSASAMNLSIPTDANMTWSIGARVDVLVLSTGMVTVVAVTPGTTTVNGTPSLVSRAQWSGLSLIKRAANVWTVVGDLA